MYLKVNDDDDDDNDHDNNDDDDDKVSAGKRSSGQCQGGATQPLPVASGPATCSQVPPFTVMALMTRMVVMMPVASGSATCSQVAPYHYGGDDDDDDPVCPGGDDDGGDRKRAEKCFWHLLVLKSSWRLRYQSQ